MECIKSMDMFPQQPSFNLNGKSSYKTFFGMFFSALVVSSSLWLMKQTLINWIYQINPSVITEKRINESFIIPIGQEYGFMIQWLIPVIPKLEGFDFSCPPMIRVISKNAEIKLDTIPIDEISHCDLPNSSVSMMNYEKANSSFVAFKFNDDFKEQIEKNLDKVLLVKLYSPDKVLKVNEPLNILLNNTRESLFPIVSTESRVYQINLMRDTYSVQGSYFFRTSKQKTYNFYPVHSVDLIGAAPKTDFLPYLTLIFQYNKSQNFTTIQYVDEEGLISAIGGMLGLLSMVGSTMNSFFASLSFEAFMINNVYSPYLVSSNHKESSSNTRNNINSKRVLGCEVEKLPNSNLNRTVYQFSIFDIFRSSFPLCRKLKHKIIKQLSLKLESNYDYIGIAKHQEALKSLFILMFGECQMLQILGSQPYRIDEENSDLFGITQLNKQFFQVNVKANQTSPQLPEFMKKNLHIIERKLQ